MSWSANRAKNDRKKRMRAWKRAQDMLGDSKSTSFPNNKGAKRYIAKDKTSKSTGLDQQKLE